MITDASFPLTAGKKIRLSFLSLASIVCGSTPLVCRNLPSSDSSPIKRASEISVFNCSDASKIPKAMGRSYDGPSFGKSAGARFTVIRLAGKSAPLFLMAERTRSFASSTALSGRPTMVKDGREPDEMSTSTSTGTASKPTTADELTLAIIF